MTSDAVRFRPPLAVRIYVVGFSALFCGFLVFTLHNAFDKGVATAMVPVAMVCFCLALAFRILRLSVLADGDALVIRNVVRTRRLLREDIEGFRVGPISNQPFAQTVYVLLRDGGLLPLDVLGRPRLGRWSTLERQRLALQTWSG